MTQDTGTVMAPYKVKIAKSGACAVVPHHVLVKEPSDAESQELLIGTWW